MPTRFALPHIDIARFKTSQTYQGSGSGGGSRILDRIAHGQRVQRELAAAFEAMETIRQVDARLSTPHGTYLEVELAAGEKADVLDMKSKNIKSGAAKSADGDHRTIALYVPDDAKDDLTNIVQAYLTGALANQRSPAQKTKVEAINAFRAVRMETLWTDEPGALPMDSDPAIWWGVWCWSGCDDDVVGACGALNLRVGSRDRWLTFPEAVVVPVLAKRREIEAVTFSTGGIAELRRATDNPSFFVDDVRETQLDWAEDAAERIIWPGANVPSVCLLDTGVNRAHVLIEPALASSDMHTYEESWGVDDVIAGHGTSMAGIALHGDLTPILSDTSNRTLKHRLESVKLIPEGGYKGHEPRSYGAITQAAVARPEIAAADRSRVFCMAITNRHVSGSKPTGWSSAIDQAAAGTMPGDDDTSPKRLFVLAAGNVTPEIQKSQLRAQDEYPIEDPSQAWNALTVGGYTDLINLSEVGYEGWQPMANAGALSPHSRTSETWPRNSPFKPEIVMEAGNRGVSPSGAELCTLPSLSLCSTGRDVGREPLVAFQATSAAAAQAARLAAQLSADHPEFWPETIRGLIVHSAEWTPPMLTALNARASKEARYPLIRQFGYGVPDYERATASAAHHLALFAQSEIQPFKLQGGRKFNECHYYDLPIPRRLLEQLENETVQLRITLSYFVDPNPGMSANLDPQRYQSHGLRFDLRRPRESLTVFKERVNVSEREDPRIGPSVVPDDNRLMLGAKSIGAGSLHCDVWTGPAIELVGRDMLCIKPVGGWARDRSTREYCNKVRRYALIVTLKANDASIDLYTPIQTQIGVPVEVSIGAGRP